ncbi:uncharacterized protein FFUJ_10762 [Fusarium fujikuroi IMI 58289]|uniref:Uncharacterized protein n=1 Tax=Gibberella fujikuroi (strain CBS 195.34 / IMI 58289 / NRRL A-6831) TaxID=1279085 RepID=S0EKL5_GIBF5|nr:uncharacterized protein FFUJ_10762 [Fusarium fujikuroi IMI 58289]CCT75135.1 uncharacterized protein FFUJ_10762 [Fusarium fujikuroi IMI 58289]
MLAFTSSQVMRLESLFKWLGMGKKHLTRNVEHRVEWPYRNIPHEIEWDIGQKAEALLRIAAYFRSRQTISINQRNLTLRSLRAAKMMEVEDMFSETKLGDGHHKPDNPSIYITDTYPQLKMVNSGSWQESALVAYVPADKKQRQFAITVALPRLLMDWLMTGREAYCWSFVDVPDLGVSLVKSVLSAPPELANDILEAEGIQQPLAYLEGRNPNIKEECLDQTEAQEAEAPLQTTRTPTSTTPEPVPAPEVNIPLADSPASQIPNFKQAVNLDALLSIVPVPGSASGQQRQKRRPATSDSASSGSPPPLAELCSAHNQLVYNLLSWLAQVNCESQSQIPRPAASEHCSVYYLEGQDLKRLRDFFPSTLLRRQKPNSETTTTDVSNNRSTVPLNRTAAAYPSDQGQPHSSPMVMAAMPKAESEESRVFVPTGNDDFHMEFNLSIAAKPRHIPKSNSRRRTMLRPPPCSLCSSWCVHHRCPNPRPRAPQNVSC